MDTDIEKIYDVAIIGGGITGTSLLYTLSRYTDLQKIVLLEKYGEFAHLNSHFNNNSQTLHFGDIETNYALEKAREVKRASSLLAGYVERYAQDAILLSHKMVLAVGDKEVTELEKRYAEFRELFPGLRRCERDRIGALEPKVMEGRNRDEKILALVSDKGYALNYQKVSASFVQEALRSGKLPDILLETAALEIFHEDAFWKIKTAKETLVAKCVVVASGPYSLLFAKKLGYGKKLGILPVSGSFYRAPGLLKGKVYTMQTKKLPFAAIHGDPAVNDPTETRFGPTAKVLPLLERHNWKTFVDFLRASVYTPDGILSLLKITFDRTIFRYIFKNLFYDIPFFGKWLFLKQVRKIIPTLAFKDLEYGIGLGGIRPQVVDTEKKEMVMGEAKIVGDGIIFDITPSPGASVSLDNARKNALQIVNFLPDHSFDEARFYADHDFEY